MVAGHVEKRRTNVLRFLNGKLQQQCVVETHSDDPMRLRPLSVDIIWENIPEVEQDATSIEG